jgi:outer membrane protein assembly factor BamE (lipoprotein component of BamABCDE complex)
MWQYAKEYYMNFRLITIVSLVILSLSGCATSSYSVGKNFSSENVSKIVKGKTTSEKMVSLFGQPYSKTVISATDEKWIYMHSEGTAKAQSYIVTMDVKTTGTQKMLDVLITDGVVANFAFTEGQNPYSMQVN